MPLSDALRDLLARPIPDGDEGETYAQALARAALDLALRGKTPTVALKALIEIADRVEGRSTQRNEVSGPAGGPIPFAPAQTREELERRLTALLQKAQQTAPDA